ncbi:MAG TPA: hypothetical protein VMV47_17990 [Bacteroidales bacterium]|nr:hypothetical protein [Bacteroidales bacterium]
MKKVILFLLSFVFFVSEANAQDYFTVIKVNGNIVIERTGNPLGTGTSFARNENLLFRIPESRAAVINPELGRFLLTSENMDEFKNSKSNFLPSSGKIRTRSVKTVTDKHNLSAQLEDNYLMLAENRILIDTAIYPMNSKDFFYLTFDYHNKTINKRLTFNADTLIIRQPELLAVDGSEIPASDIKQMKLIYYQEGDSFVLKPVCSFSPVFADLNVLWKEISIIIHQMEMNTYEEKLNEINAFIQEFYGSIDETNLKRWLKEDLGLNQ